VVRWGAKVPIVENGPETYLSGEVVVALSDYPIVRSTLLELPQVVAAELDKDRCDETLGLGMINLEYSPGQAGLSSSETGPGAPDPSALGRMLDEVRARCAGKFGGWEPIIGKNRMLKVEGVSGYVGGGGNGLPSCAEPPRALTHPADSSGRGVRVAVLDTGLIRHPDLAGRYIADTADLLDEMAGRPYMGGHATFVVGVILQRAPAAEIRLHRVLSDKDATATTWEVARKMVEFAGADVSLLNLSLGCFTWDGEPPLLLRRAVEILAPTMVIVAAAGNHGLLPPEDEPDSQPTKCSPMWPAAFPDVVAVAARDQDGIAPFSPRLPWVDFTAPGVDIPSAYLSTTATIVHPNGTGGEAAERGPFKGYASWSGSSFAAANVTGEIAAQTVPGGKTAREVLHDLRTGPTHDGVIRYRYRPS
jgi:membrane-anchored mycosin MYCP